MEIKAKPPFYRLKHHAPDSLKCIISGFTFTSQPLMKGYVLEEDILLNLDIVCVWLKIQGI